MIGAVVDLDNGGSVVYEDHHEKFIREIGCLIRCKFPIRCQLPIKFPFRVPVNRVKLIGG